MSLKNTQFDSIMREYDRKQLHSRHLLDSRTEEVYHAIPRIAEINTLMAAASAGKARAMLSGASDNLQDLKVELEQLSKEKQMLLTDAGYPPNYLEPQYECPLCKDTGYINGEKCICFRQAAISLLYHQSNIQDVLEKENFGAFSFDYYSDKIVDKETGKTPLEHARFALNKSMEFVERFHEQKGNLFIFGDTGVGKTFLSHCIAGEILHRGFSVLYFSAYELFSLLAQQEFSYGEKDASLTLDSICAADLLIIDDLGTELTNNFVKSQLFSLINERLVRGRSTIISTNYEIGNFSEVYTTRIFSRIMESYTILNLIGKDIRLQKKALRGGNHETK